MSTAPDDDGFSFAPPPFRPDEALQRLRRDLRELGLTEREGTFERRGRAIARAQVAEGALQVAVVRKPSRHSPEWAARTLDNSGAVRDFVADLRKKLAQWNDSDD